MREPIFWFDMDATADVHIFRIPDCRDSSCYTTTIGFVLFDLHIKLTPFQQKILPPKPLQSCDPKPGHQQGIG